MSVEVKTPYEETPYETLSDPELGPLSTEATCREVEQRLALLAKRRLRSEAAREAWDILRSPGKRIGWDIFYSPIERGQQALQELIEDQPTFRPVTVGGSDLSFGREFLLWGETTPDEEPPDFTFREVTLSLSTLYDDLESRLREVVFDV